MKYLKLFSFTLLVFFLGCSSTTIRIDTIKIKGSDTMLRVMKNLAKEFCKLNPGVSIFVEGGGTSQGVKSLTGGSIDICTASRTLLPEEVKELSSKYSAVGVSTFIAQDAICVHVNNSNPINDISLEQLKKIFTGKITKWESINGEGNLNLIQALRLDSNSGTTELFKNRVLENKDFSPGVEVISSLENLLKEIEEQQNAICFSGLGNPSASKILSINEIFPNKETIKNGSYPLSRYLHLYTISNPTGAVKEFIDWILSASGQNLIAEQGFIPLFANNY